MAKKSAVRVTPSTESVSGPRVLEGGIRAPPRPGRPVIQVSEGHHVRRLKQAEAAKVLRVTQPRVSDLLRGRIDLFSTDA